MSIAVEMLVHDLSGTAGILMKTVADFTDAEMLMRPAPAANHPLWQIGHLCVSESSMLNKFGNVPSTLPDDFAAKFKNKFTNHEDSPEFFKIGKDALLKQFDAVRQSTIAFTKTLSDADLGKATNWDMAPTLGNVIGLNIGHAQMHVGQIQVLRRKLGKPIIF